MHRRTYQISDLVDYINWDYFFHAWGIHPPFTTIVNVHGCDACRLQWEQSFPEAQQEQASAASRLYQDARQQLARLTPYTSVQAILLLAPAYSDGDDIVVGNIRIPCLRQQTPDSDGFCHCLADYVSPRQPQLPLPHPDTDNTIGIFATTTHTTIPTSDDYRALLTQTLADRLAEAAAESLHQETRTTLWGYAPQERLTIQELHAEKFQGTRPAIGYPSMPDLSVNFLLDQLLHFADIGISLTEHAMMQPHASVSGLMLAHPQSRYFNIGPVSNEQLTDYARRRNLPLDTVRQYIT